MGTKNDPGKYDCYASADPDEPLFVLRGSETAARLSDLLRERDDHLHFKERT